MNNAKNYTTSVQEVHIEKFEGSFATEQGGCSVFINSTVNSIHWIDSAGIYLYLMCRPTGWKLNVKHLMNHFDCGKDKIYKCLTNLKVLGLLTSQIIRDKNGKFLKQHYILHLHPQPQSNKGISPFPEKPDPVNPHTYKTKKVINKDLNTTTTLACAREEKKVVQKDNNSEVVITKEIDKRLLQLKNEYLIGDSRWPDEFLRQCSHHLDNGNKAKYNLARRLKGLETIIKTGFFDAPEGYHERKTIKSLISPEDRAILHEYFHAKRLEKIGADFKFFMKDEKKIARAMELINRPENEKWRIALNN